MDHTIQADSELTPRRHELPRPSGWTSWLPKFMLRPIYHPKVFQAFERYPVYHRAVVSAWSLAMCGGPLGRDVKEALAVAVSAANRCPY